MTDNNELPPLPTPSAGNLLRPGKPKETVYTADQMHAYARAALAQRQGESDEVTRDREADRQSFGDPEFNRWLDESITENGEFTVWHTLKSTNDAYAGFVARLAYISKQAEPVAKFQNEAWDTGKCPVCGSTDPATAEHPRAGRGPGVLALEGQARPLGLWPDQRVRAGPR